MRAFPLLTAATLTAIAASAIAETAPSRDGGFGLGREALPEEIAAWNIDIRPDGQGLPVGSGDVWTGDELYVTNCASCHGFFGEGEGRWPILAGGFGTLDGEDPTKTIGSYWPYLSTAWDYIHRAMPYGNAQALSDDEVYAILAYILYLNDMVDDDFVLSNENFAEVAMANAEGFYMDDRAEVEYPSFTAEPCMTNCAPEVQITMRAAVLDVTPEDDTPEETPASATVEDEAAADTGPDPALIAAGEAVFRQCSSCHQIGDGARAQTGPHLNGVIGAAAAAQEGFRYSPVLRRAGEDGLVWTQEELAAFLTDPRSYLPRNRMTFRGLDDPGDVAAVLAYIQSAGGQ